MWSNLIQLTHRLENAILAGLLLLVIVAANGQIILRNLLELPIVWLDPFLRVTILWLALFGAMVATRQQSHIAIDLLNRYLPLQWCLLAERIVHAFSAVICALLAWYSLLLVLLEYEDGLTAFARVPVWLCQSIMPFAFTIMALRFLWQSLQGSHRLDNSAHQDGEPL